MLQKPKGAPKSGYAVLLPFLQQQGRTVDHVLGDGNCLFRSLSVQLTGTQDHHLQLRKLIATFEKTEEVFEKLHKAINKTPFLSHVQNMKRTCVWGKTVEVIATASLFQVDVYMATESYTQEHPTWLRYTPRTTATSHSTKLMSTISPYLKPHIEWIEIAHVCRSHFDSIKPVLPVKLACPSWPTCTTPSFLDLSD